MVTSDDVRKYKVTRGETLEERVDDLEDLVRRHFSFDSLEEVESNLDGNDTVYKTVPENAGLNALFVGKVTFDNKKSRFVLGFDEVEPKTLDEEDMDDLSKLLNSKNALLKDATGYTAKQRRDQMRRNAKD